MVGAFPNIDFLILVVPRRIDTDFQDLNLNYQMLDLLLQYKFELR